MTEPTRLTLGESSGPVSPRFQYILNLSMEVAEDRVLLQWDVSGAAPLLRGGSGRGEIPLDLYRQFWQDRTLPALPERAPGRRIGVSQNFLELIFASGPIRYAYHLAQIEEEPAWEGLVNGLKELAARYQH